MKITTAFIFLLFSGAVAFSHMMLGNYEYIVFMVPFILACILRNPFSKISETAGLLIIGLYTLIIRDQYVGMTILYAASCWFFVYVHRGKRAAYFVVAIALIIGAISYLGDYHQTENKLLHAILDASFYGFGSWALIFTLNQFANIIRAEKPDDRKYIELIERLQTLAHEYVNTLKRGADNDRRGKD